jgi:hypothetical protein
MESMQKPEKRDGPRAEIYLFLRRRVAARAMGFSSSMPPYTSM